MNPAQIWHAEAQTYASAKDNARALYADTLAPLLNMYENVLNAFLLPMVGEEPSHYVEFDLEAKLAGSFEERASVMQSAVGGPWMTRNEARAKLNMPAIDGADDLIVPLNVTEGGLASPRDTDPTVERHNAAPHFAKAGDAAPFADGAATVVLKSRAVPPEALVDEISEALARHVRRQAARVTADLAKSAASGAKAVPGDLPEWWDAARWDRELADDLEPILRRIVDQRGMAAHADIGEDVSGWDPGRVAAFVRSMAELRASRFNGGTLDAALDVLGGGSGDEAEQVADAILSRAEGPADAAARTYATAASGFATKEAVRQVFPRDTDAVRRTKTWRHHESRSPRSDHAAMDGETVGLDERFSNGADYPGDWTHGPANNVNCHCTMDVGVERRGGGSGHGGDGDNPPAGGGDDDREERIRRRIENAREIGVDLYDETPQMILARAEEIDAELKRIYRGTQNVSTDRNAYARYADYVKSFASNAPITIEDFATIEGKELQIASWFSRQGVEVHFRNHSRHSNTSDVRMHDMLFDFKRVASPVHQQISTIVKKKLRTQGPGFVIDLSASDISLEDAVMECAHTLERDQVERMLIIKDARLIEVRK